MPQDCTHICIIENTTLVVLACILLLLVYKKAWQDKAMRFILINAAYSFATNLFSLFHPITTVTYDTLSNLTMHIDTLSALGFFYHLWNNSRWHKFLRYSVAPVILVWLGTFIVMRDLQYHWWTLLMPSVWYLAAGIYALYFLYKKGNFQETSFYVSRFLLITGFLFYNFVYIVIEICYIYFKGVSNSADAWNINYWSYLIFRVMMLAGVIAWYARPGIRKAYAFNK